MSRSSSLIRTCERSPFSASACSSSVSTRSRASSSSRSSMSGGSSIENTRKSPSWRSSSTTAWRDEPGVFLYAARSASSSAAISVSPSIPLSRSSSWTSSMISRLISAPLFDQVSPHDLRVRDVHLVAVDADRDRFVVGTDDLASYLGPLGGLQLDPPADRAAEVLRLAERPFEARRRDVDGVLAQVVPEDARHLLAERVVDAFRAIDEDREPFRSRQLDREHLDVGQALADPRADLTLQLVFLFVDARHMGLLTKNGRRAPISPNR